VNIDQVEQKYKDRGLEVEHGRDEPGKIYPPHRHEETFLYTVSGSVKVKVDNKDWNTLKSGTEFTIGKDQLHEAVVSADGWEYIAAWNSEEAKEFTHSEYSKSNK
jgi:quercetin dioxygenase-like cupin family protein